jgi:chemotaxis methyl-accepting protein methylase
VARPWPPELASYWKSFGDRIGVDIMPIRPPEIFRGLETRAVRIRPEVVLACQQLDLDIVLERLNLDAAHLFDLIVATNIFVYYDVFEQALAIENTGSMLKPGGLLLTNDRLSLIPSSSMRLDGITMVPYDLPHNAREAVSWYRKR